MSLGAQNFTKSAFFSVLILNITQGNEPWILWMKFLTAFHATGRTKRNNMIAGKMSRCDKE